MWGGSIPAVEGTGDYPQRARHGSELRRFRWQTRFRKTGDSERKEKEKGRERNGGGRGKLGLGFLEPGEG